MPVVSSDYGSQTRGKPLPDYMNYYPGMGGPIPSNHPGHRASWETTKVVPIATDSHRNSVHLQTPGAKLESLNDTDDATPMEDVPLLPFVTSPGVPSPTPSLALRRSTSLSSRRRDSKAQNYSEKSILGLPRVAEDSQDDLSVASSRQVSSRIGLFLKTEHAVPTVAFISSRHRTIDIRYNATRVCKWPYSGSQDSREACHSRWWTYNFSIAQHAARLQWKDVQ